MKWLILGVGFVVVMALVAFGTLMMIGGDNASVSESEATHESEKVKKDSKKETKPKTSADWKAAAEDEDESLLSKMMENLAVLDYMPGPDEMMTQDGSMSIQDYTDGANWLAKEKHKLAKRERTLELKQRELEKVDRKVSQKLLRIEQAESSRINQLAKLYDSMEPQSVAQLMRNLEDEIVYRTFTPHEKQKCSNSLVAFTSQTSRESVQTDDYIGGEIEWSRLYDSGTFGCYRHASDRNSAQLRSRNFEQTGCAASDRNLKRRLSGAGRWCHS